MKMRCIQAPRTLGGRNGRKALTAYAVAMVMIALCCVALTPSQASAASERAEHSSSSGQERSEMVRSAPGWVKASHGWWYRYADGTWPANASLTIKGKTYRFNAKGWMVTGWSLVANEWRYYARSGAMTTGWQKIKGKWYYLDPANGAMLTDWQKVKGKWYWLDPKNGDMKTGWIKDGGDWYYANKSGARITGWQKVKGKWYYLDPASAKMRTGFYEVKGLTYYSDRSGVMKTGWGKLDSGWYYFEKSGAMAKNTWVSGKYWVGSDGKWITDPSQSDESAGTTSTLLKATLEAEKKAGTIAQGILRDTVFALVSSAENSTTDYNAEYGYIEDIGDGRGYTCGIIGFTSATGDLLDVVKLYIKLAPNDNPLKPYVSALEAAVGSDTHNGLGAGFVSAWKKASKTPQMKEAQNEILNEQYMLPAVGTAQVDGLSPLGQYIYYDALVVHGPGNDADSFGGIRAVALKKAKTPAQGGNEADYLTAFLDARTKVMLKEEAHSDLSRINVQRTFIKEKKWDLARPLIWTMYGDRFELR